jgi:class 3 adenylate cyclase
LRLPSGSTTVWRVEPSEEIRRVVHRWLVANIEGDGDAVMARISEHPALLAVGTDAEEWWHAAERAVWRRQIEESGGFPIAWDEIEASEEGSVGWAGIEDDHPAPKWIWRHLRSPRDVCDSAGAARPLRNCRGRRYGDARLHGHEADRFFGTTVNYAARVASHALGGEVLVSNLVHDLITGSGIEFLESRDVELKGLDGTHRLFAVAVT